MPTNSLHSMVYAKNRDCVSQLGISVRLPALPQRDKTCQVHNMAVTAPSSGHTQNNVKGLSYFIPGKKHKKPKGPKFDFSKGHPSPTSSPS